jgi:hypothetical protein
MKTVKEKRLTTETVQGASLSLKCVDNVEGGDGLALGVLSVGDGVTDDTLKEGLQHTTGLLVDHWGRLAGEEWVEREGGLTGWDTLDTTTTRQTADSGLSDTLDVVAENLAVTLGATLAETLATFAA